MARKRSEPFVWNQTMATTAGGAASTIQCARRRLAECVRRELHRAITGARRYGDSCSGRAAEDQGRDRLRNKTTLA